MKLTKWNQIFKRSLSALLALIMLFGTVPVTIFATEDAQVMESAEVFSIKLELSGVSSGMDSSGTPENVGYYAACGDSITHANHALVEDIAADDKYYPIDGYSGTTYARKNYAYYIAQRNNLQWANYGYGGTTLHHCYPKGYGGTAMRTFPFVDERITQLKEDIDWDYISIFFGYNDAVYGPAQQRDFWLTETYGEELGYPVNDSQIGTEGFANAEQKAACDAATGSVGGVAYSDNTEYFFAKFVGTVDDTETTTFLGAYNYALDYLTKKYPAAKIMIVNPYVSGTNNTRKIIRDGVNAVAEKWGVSCMDFSDLPYWFYRVDQKRIEYPNPHREDGRWYAENGKANFAGTVEGFNRARFTTDGTHPSNLGYQTISQPMERFLIGSDNTVNVLQGEPFEAELILDDIYTGMDVSVTMGGTDITDQCYANGKIRIASVTGNVIIRASGNIAYTDGHTYSASVTPPTCTEAGYTTYTCTLCGNSYVDDYVDATGHSYENGTCTLCGAEDPDAVTESLSLRYDDHYDVTGKTVEIIDAGKPTSYQVGYGVEENAVPDTAVVILEGDTLVATGIGTAKVSIDGQLYEVTVEAAPISLLLLIGQSNMRGSEGNANQSIVCPDGMVYATYGDDRGADNTAMTVSNATHFAPSALTGEYSSINVEGTTDCLSGYPVYSLTEAGAGKIGPDSGFAYEWVRQTGEKVWIVNAAHGGTSINVWQPGTTEYEQCQALFTACQETLRKEIAAGHFTLSHMAYFWCQGCSDRTQSAQWYVNKYLAMHEGLKTEMAFDHDTNPDTADKTFEFGGIIPVRVGSTAACYRDGVYSVSNPYAYHESFVDLRFSGPRVAQYWMINNPELTDIWGVCDIGDDWVWMPDGTNGVSAYFQAHYPGGRVDYTTQVTQKESWYTPTTPAAVHDSVHYNQIGYNEYGREAVRNALIMLGEIAAPDVETTVELLSWDGYSPVEQVIASTAGNSGTLVVPRVYPIWKSKEVTYELSGGLSWEYYDLLAADAQTEGTLTAGGKTVHVAKAEPGVHYAEHLSELPEEICCGLNLWNVLEHDPYFYSTGTHWDIHSSGNVFSVTIPVNPGDRIFATAFGKAGENGHATSNGIRVTFFSEYGVARTLAPAECYAEFTANGGCLTAPEGTTAVNIAMWNNSADNELYLLDRGHDTDSGICGICGKDSHVHQWSDWAMKEIPGKGEPVTEERICSGCGETATREVESVWQKYDLAAHYSDLPENVCAGLNLWNVLAHDKYYFASGTNWAVYSSGGVCSVTIPVNPGDRIFATAFGKAVENGHATANGIRVTFFSAYGIAKTMTPAECYAEFTANGGCLIAPENAIAINVAMWNGSDENELYILNRDHVYANGTCTVCGADHPNLANFEGKVISILSASTSTFAGYIPTADGFNLEHRPRYPQDNLLTDVNETWWMQVINELDAKLGINDSWAGSQVLNTRDTNSGDLGPDAAMASLTRIKNLGSNGTPDVILFFGGGNDMGRGVPLGSFDPATAPTEVDLTAQKWDSFADAYVAAIMRLQYFYPDTEIIVMTTYAMPSYVTAAKLDQYGPVIRAICDHYGVKYVDMRDCGLTFDMLPDNIHPNAEGMDYITADVLDTLLNRVELEPGENVVHSVTHTLTNAGASRSYYKGISSGNTFEETLSGEDLSVTVTMDGRDITASVYADGTIRIPAVTGNVVITAVGSYNVDGHLQQLPQEICPGVNLWTALNPENIYYTVSGWGNTTAGTTWSITFPVQPGDRIWATSLGKTPENGSSANGVRVTWFDENGVLQTVSREAVYAEFAKNGYITAPEGAVALNLPMTGNQEHYAVYILSAEHDYIDDICTICRNHFVNTELEGHLQQLPDRVCAGTNLWDALEPENIYYLGDKWGLYASAPDVHSITFAVEAGDRIWATSFQSAADKGCSGDATRITWFDEDGVLESVPRESVYEEFIRCGYITVPEGAVAVNIPSQSKDNCQVYILSRDHIYENSTCVICGAANPDHHTPGDINGDGEVDNKDLTRLFKHLSGYTVEVVESALDVNGDGEVDNKDLTRLFRYLSNYDVEIH